ncbi:hypothetical protein DFR49_1234 [Hephaestia caeni]|uniref:Hydroxymethylpyrimidine pyrophosphatase-like HAD family hydrolase n=1 Tax=Hephaestia caeni TaxID=645617 RepID=A0A397PAT5_9SPHN|nr:HAD hydrolase family protein [Hephaestia caeni]RIA46686.1 hypothetical protein DFR49_1234 [Hephaestia caeni]
MAGQFRYIEMSYRCAGFRTGAIIRAPLSYANASARRALSDCMRRGPADKFSSLESVRFGTVRPVGRTVSPRFSQIASFTGLPIRLIACDVEAVLESDGTLAPTTIEAAARIAGAGIDLTFVSARSPFAVGSIARTIGLNVPTAAFNGGMIVDPRGTILSDHPLPAATSRVVLGLFDAAKVTIWVYAQGRWFTNNSSNPRNRREQQASRAQPIVVPHFDTLLGRIDKIVAVSDDVAHIRQLEYVVKETLGARAEVSRPQDCYCDVVHPIANKAAGIMMLAKMIGVPLSQIAVIGSLPADVPMMIRAGYSFALDTAPEEIAAVATRVVGTGKGGTTAALDALVAARGVFITSPAKPQTAPGVRSRQTH